MNLLTKIGSSKWFGKWFITGAFIVITLVIFQYQSSKISALSVTVQQQQRDISKLESNLKLYASRADVDRAFSELRQGVEQQQRTIRGLYEKIPAGAGVPAGKPAVDFLREGCKTLGIPCLSQ